MRIHSREFFENIIQSTEHTHTINHFKNSVNAQRSLASRAGKLAKSFPAFRDFSCAHSDIFIETVRSCRAHTYYTYVYIYTHACTHDTRAISPGLLLLEHAFPSASASRRRPESREAILDPWLKDASAFPGVPYKEFNSKRFLDGGGTCISSHFAHGGSLIRLARKCSAIEEIQEVPCDSIDVEEPSSIQFLCPILIFLDFTS